MVFNSQLNLATGTPMSSETLPTAFKEWAAVCHALDQGRQCLILRKGGISEEGGSFRAEHPEFLLYPTHFHEHRGGLKPEYQDVFDDLAAAPPAGGTIAFSNFVSVAAVHYVTNLATALALDPLHAWTADVVRQRFHYRSPGLYVLLVRVHRLSEPAIRNERPEYAGCKTWVQLDSPIPTIGSAPVLSDEAFAEQVEAIRKAMLS